MATTKATTAAKAEVKKEEVKAVVETKKTEAPKAVVKKTVAKKAEAPKAEAKKAEAPKAEAKKVEAPKAEAKKVEAPKAETKKVEAPKAAAKAPAKKATAKKAEAPKAAAKAPAKKATTKATAKKAVATADIAVQFAGKSYTQEDLVKIANDVWVYDFNKKASELKKIELFVKPEESKVYYVFNGDVTGDFDI